MDKPLDIYIPLNHLWSPVKRIQYEQFVHKQFVDYAPPGNASLKNVYTVGTVPDCSIVACMYPVVCTKCFANLLCGVSPMIYDVAYIVAQYCADETTTITVFARTYDRFKIENGLGGLAYSN